MENVEMKLIPIIFITLALLLTACSSGPTYSSEQLDTFATCLTDAQTTMYGTFWCPHCAKTKKMFGTSFKHINYVECDPRGDDEQAEFCIEQQIDKYDTWTFADGSRLISEPSLEELSQKSGCPLPEASE